MNVGDILLLAGTVFLLAAWVPAIGILRTWSRVPWKSNKLGRVLHDKNLSIAVILTLQVIGIGLIIFHIGRPLWFEVLRLIVLAWVARALWRQWMAYRELVRNGSADDKVVTEDDLSDGVR